MHRLATPLTIVDPKSGAKAVIDRTMLAEAIHTALRTESTAAQIPLAIHLVADSQWIKASQLIGTPPSGGRTLMMADEIFCSEAWARFDPANVARQGAASYALPLEVADAEERAAMCEYLPPGPYRRTTQPRCAPTPRSCGWPRMATLRIRQRT